MHPKQLAILKNVQTLNNKLIQNHKILLPTKDAEAPPPSWELELEKHKKFCLRRNIWHPVKCLKGKTNRF